MTTRRRMLLQTGRLFAGAGLATLLGDHKAFALTAAQGQLIYTNALSMQGVAYVLGAPGWPQNTDCSKLTQGAYGSARILIPRTAAEQFRACRISTNMKGALIFFATDDARPGVVTHVGINRGDGTMVDANSAQGVVIEENWSRSNYWARRFVASGTP